MMEIILLEKIRNLGDLGETVRVANGYARNYLIPQKKAMRATADALVEVEKRRRELAVQEGKRVEAAQAKADLLAREIVLSRLVNESGALYGSVSPADIAEALSGEHAQVEKSEIAQAQPIKHPGEYQVEVILHAEVRLSVTIQVIGEGAPVVDGEVIADDAAVVDAATYESSAPAEVRRETPPMIQPAAVKPEVRHEDKREVKPEVSREVTEKVTPEVKPEVKPQPKPEVQAETPSVETIAPADVVVKEDDTPPVAPVVEPETPPVVVAESKPVEIKKEEVAKKSVDTPPVAPVVEPQTPPVVAAESKPTETKKKVVAKKAVAKKTAKKTVAKKAVAKKATAKKAVSKTTAKKTAKKAAKKVAKKTAKKAAKKAAAK